jgi:hypothetical protein
VDQGGDLVMELVRAYLTEFLKVVNVEKTG